MDVHKSGRLKAWTPLLFSLVLIIGMVLGFNLRDTLRNKRDIQTVMDRNDRLEEIIDLINEKYVDTVNADDLYKDAVSGILKNLDPHTSYIPAEELQGVTENLEGGFFGIGVEFSIIKDTIEVTSVIPDGPADHAGVEIGDQLIRVGDTVVAGTRITSEHIIHLLKGKQHSKVLVTMRESLAGKEKRMSITRDEVPIYSLEAGIMLDSITGYIKINRFSATTYNEFSTAMKTLKGKGLKQLVIDLRENPGGYLDAATTIADELLSGNKLIVFTKGVHTPKTEYKAGEDGMFESGRLAILVDESSASASEILAGAVQDWDRGVIIGRRSFGKGLVQEQYDMADGAAMRLTVAKYYTPSGRCIQRSFKKGKEAYAEDFEKRFQDGELTGNDTGYVQEDTMHYYTAKHRPVYGGGGIKPDVYVPYDTARISAGLLSVVFSDELKTALWEYFIHNRARLNFKNINAFDYGFADGGVITNAYLSALKPRERKIVEKILAGPGNTAYFNLQVKAQLARFLFRNNGYYSIAVKDDNVVGRAVGVLYSPNYSKLIGRQ